MPAQLSYPGVYIEEVPSGVRTIVGVATSITAMIGSAVKGPVGESVRIQNLLEFERIFGGLSPKHPLGNAVRQFFSNGGTDAEIVRVVGGDNSVKAKCEFGGLVLEADSPGAWMNEYGAQIDDKTKQSEDDATLFNLRIGLLDKKQPVPTLTVLETHRNLSLLPESSRYVTRVLKEDSRLVNVVGDVPDQIAEVSEPTEFKDGEDGDPISGKDLLKGLEAFKTVDLFNLMVIPPLPVVNDNNAVTGAAPLSDEEGLPVYTEAANICDGRRAMLLLDPKSTWDTVAVAKSDLESDTPAFGELRQNAKNCALFFPNLKMSDPSRDGRIVEFSPAAAVAGVFARTDVNRGVWKAPAGQTDGALAGVQSLSVKMTDGENGQLNPLGVNCLRSFPLIGNVIWGARTLDGADRLASEWKYIPVRRTALFIEESLLRGTKWAVFEPNDEPLWAQLRSAIRGFMQGLFRQGAFQGQTPDKAYFVKVDSETTTQDDIDRGIVNIHVGFAPLKPAEFVVIKLQQIAGREIA